LTSAALYLPKPGREDSIHKLAREAQTGAPLTHQREKPVVRAEAPGRPRKTSISAWVDDLSALHKALTFCSGCRQKFNHKLAGYYQDRKLPFCIARCDGCNEHANRAQLYIHESYLTEPGGKTRHGQCWTPR
jgi:hypothetical protein